MPQPLHELKSKLFHEEVSRKQIQEAIGKSKGYVAQHLAGERCFDLREVYIICKLANIAKEDIAKYFPPEEMGVEKWAV